MIEVKGYPLVNRADEMSLELYEKVSELLEAKVARPGDKPGAFDYEGELEKWLDILEACGLPKRVGEEMELGEIPEAVKLWNSTKVDPYPMLKEIEVKGKIYRAYDGEKWILNVKDGKLIEKYARQNPKKYVGEMLAVIFKDEELTDNEHYANGHIKHKANIFRKEVKASVAVPYLMHVAKKILFAGSKELENAEKESEAVASV